MLVVPICLAHIASLYSPLEWFSFEKCIIEFGYTFLQAYTSIY
jgi:hypothetical protein